MPGNSSFDFPKECLNELKIGEVNVGIAFRILAVGLAASLLGACAEEFAGARSWIESNLPRGPYEEAKMAAPKGSAFNRHLYDGYLKLADAERAEYDWRDGDWFSRKALAAADDQEVSPDGLYERNLPEASVAELKAARNDLTELLGGGARRASPEQAAEAQVSFDCWAQEQEENIQPDDIAACRDRFEAALGKVKLAMGRPAGAYVVYFDTGKASLNQGQIEKLMRAASVAKGGSLTVQVSGHTDAAGAEAKNLALSEARANMVEDLLVSAGVKAEQIRTSHYGAAQPAIRTAAGAAEARNRRVEIKLLK